MSSIPDYETLQISEKLVGKTIIGAIRSSCGQYFGFKCRDNSGGNPLHVWINQDPEGNGPGHLEIEVAKTS
jgi:hypothetical protein